MCAIMGFSKKTYTKEELLPFFDRTRSRGPDMSQILRDAVRLAVLSPAGHHGPDGGAGCSPLSWTGTMWSATASSTASAAMKQAADGARLHLPQRQRLRDPASPVPGVRPGDVRQAGRGVRPDHLRSQDGTSSSPPGIPSASGPCTTAMTEPAPSSLPASRKTWWGCVRRSAPSRRDTTTRTESSSAMRTSPPSTQYCPDDLETVCRQHPQQADRGGG